MCQLLFPIFIEAAELASQLNNSKLQVIDMSAAELCSEGHIPGAIHLEYSEIIAQHPTILGLLPEYSHLQSLFSKIGLRNDRHLVVYDTEGSGKSARLLWTLACCGFENVSILNGGRNAWIAGNYPLNSNTEAWPASHFTVTPSPEVIADKAYILNHLETPSVQVLDARSHSEFYGIDRRAARGGHIPNAKNLDWTLTFDNEDNLRLKPKAIIEALLAERQINPSQEIIVHCQSHHRSALMYAILKSLGYTKVRGYHGSWSEWGNCTETPIEI